MSFLNLKSIFGKSNKKPNLFIHIPKCGGSTFVGLLKDSIKIKASEKAIPTQRVEQVGNVAIKHVDFSVFKRPFKSPDIFFNATNQKYENHNLFMLVRHPADRVFSEFNFQYHILNGKSGNPAAALYARLKPRPKNFEQYFKNPGTQNYQCKFLLGRGIADPSPISEKDFDRIIDTIEKLNIHCGTTDQYPHFLENFESIAQIKLRRDTIRRKQTPSHLKKELTEKTKQKIVQSNAFDMKLYQYICQKLENASATHSPSFTIKDQDDFIA